MGRSPRRKSGYPKTGYRCLTLFSIFHQSIEFIMDSLLEAALLYKDWGYSVVPVLENKRPPLNWKRYQTERMTERGVFRYFRNPFTKGVAIVCGEISGHFEALDFDDKNDPTFSIYDRFHAELSQRDPLLASKLVPARTKNNGHHLYYRCPQIGSSTALAQRPSTLEELKVNPSWRIRVLIETIGNGGIVIVPPSIGYHFTHHGLQQVASIQPADRTLLHQLARSFNLYKSPVFLPPTFPFALPSSDQPLTDYNERGDVISLLQHHDWYMVYSTPERTFFRRPGKTEHYTSANFHHQLRRFWVWSNNTDFTAQTPYTPSAVYAILRCKQDFRQAAKELIALGYGKAYKRA
jgi:hypothetical protein